MNVTEVNVMDALSKTEREEFSLALKAVCMVLEDLSVQVKSLRIDVDKLIENGGRG